MSEYSLLLASTIEKIQSLQNERWEIYALSLVDRSGYENFVSAWRTYRQKVNEITSAIPESPSESDIDTAENRLETARIALREAWKLWQTIPQVEPHLGNNHDKENEE